jgi:hypothetical protein
LKREDKMSTKSIFLLIGFLVSVLSLISCESDKITGIATSNLSVTILDQFSKPVSGAEVQVFNKYEYSSISNMSGQVSFLELYAINTMIRVKKQGFYRAYFSVALSKGDNSKIISLEPIEEFIEDFESGDLSDDWVLSGEGNWFVTDDESYSGNYSAKSGEIENFEQCTLSTTVEIKSDEMALSFWYKTSTDYSDHYFEFYINDEKILSISGENDWQEFIIALSEEKCELKWTLNKEYYGYESEGVWIDDFSIFEISSE